MTSEWSPHLSFGQKTQQPIDIVQKVNACFGELAVLNTTTGQRLDQLNEFDAASHLIVQVAPNEARKFFVYEIGERLLLSDIVNFFRVKKG